MEALRVEPGLEAQRVDLGRLEPAAEKRGQAVVDDDAARVQRPRACSAMNSRLTPLASMKSRRGYAVVRELWAKVEEHREKLSATGELEARRQKQLVRWMWNMIEERLMSELHAAPAVRALLPTLEQQLRGGQVTATTAATAVLDAFEHHKTHA